MNIPLDLLLDLPRKPLPKRIHLQCSEWNVGWLVDFEVEEMDFRISFVEQVGIFHCLDAGDAIFHRGEKNMPVELLIFVQNIHAE